MSAANTARIARERYIVRALIRHLAARAVLAKAGV